MSLPSTQAQPQKQRLFLAANLGIFWRNPLKTSIRTSKAISLIHQLLSLRR
jgi:hypothetical protein